MSHNLTNEVLESPLVSLLVDRRPLEFVGVDQKMQKLSNFANFASPQNLYKEIFTRLGSCERARTHGGPDDFWPSQQ